MEFCRLYEDFVNNLILVSSPFPGNINFSQKALSNFLLYSYYSKSSITNDDFRIIKLTHAQNRNKFFDIHKLLSYYETLPQSQVLSTSCKIIWGKNDLILPHENAFILEKHFKHAKVALLPKCGHLPHEEKADDFNKLVLQYLS